jgi:hypothetical protein
MFDRQWGLRRRKSLFINDQEAIIAKSVVIINSIQIGFISNKKLYIS